jgi:hypothetical protein
MALYGIQNVSSLEIISIVEWSGSVGELIPPDGYSIYSGSLDSYTSSYYVYPPTPYTGSFTGSFYGQLYGSSSYAETASYITDVTLDNVDHITFDTTSTTTPTEATFVWNDGDGTLDLGLKGGNVTLQLGQEQLARVYNAEATTLNDGEIVYISGSQGNRIAVKRADSTNEDGSRNTLGMVTETILSGEEGFVTTGGVVHGLNTIGLTAGATIFLGTNGQYTQTRPTAPNHTVIVGFVERVHASQGSIFVKIDNGYELNELHNIVADQPTLGDLLIYSGSVWTGSKALSGSYSLTGSLFISGSVTGSFSGSLEGTSSYATSASYAIIQKDIKSGAVSSGWALTGGQYVYDVSFGTQYTTEDYSVTVTAVSDARIWTVQSKIVSGFRINSNSNIPLTGDVYWMSIPYNS